MYLFIENIGKKFLGTIYYFGSLSFLTVSSFKKIFEKRRRRNVLKHVEEIGLKSFALVGIISTFIGMVMVMETAYTLKKFGAEIYTGGIVSISMIRELGPVMVALVIAGRVGAAIAAEIGAMKTTEQVDALEVMAVDPVSYLVTPRLLAGMIAIPTLFIFSFFLAILGGFIIGVFMVGIGPGMFLHQSFKFISLKDIIVGLIKVLVFGIIIVNSSCHEGFRAKGGAEGVGKAATLAVVTSFFLIILANLILTAIFYFM